MLAINNNTQQHLFSYPTNAPTVQTTRYTIQQPLIGVDTNFSVTTAMYDAFYQDPKFKPSRLQQQKVDAGYHGRKSGKGFYEYPPE